MVEIGTYLKQLRGGLSLREAAKRSGLGHTSIASLEAGSRKPSPEALRDLAKAYNYSYEQLMEKAGYIDLQNKNPDPLVNEKESLEKFDPFMIFELVKKYTDDEIIDNYYHTENGKEIDIEKIKMHLSYVRFLNSQK